MVAALAVACQHNGPLWIFLQKLFERRGDIAVCMCQRLLAIVGFAGIAEGEKSGLSVARGINITAAIEDAGLIAHDCIVGVFIGSRVIQRLVPMVAAHVGGGMHEKNRDVCAGFGRKTVGLHVSRVLLIRSCCPIVGVGVVRSRVPLVLCKALARRNEIKHCCHHERAVDERPAC